MSNTKKYDVALSFAGEDRTYVEMVADGLKARGVTVFYDDYETADLWGKNLYEHLTSVYKDQARYTVLFISKSYREKLWARHERRAAMARAFQENQEYILPARFNDSIIDGLLETIGYIDLRRRSPEEVCLLICRKLGHKEFEQKGNVAPSLMSKSVMGEAKFDYTNFDGVFRIGRDLFLFETKWSAAGADCVHCYNDPTSINGIALAAKGSKLADITDACMLDFTSRTRTPEEGRFIVFRNENGFYSAVEVVDVKNEKCGDEKNELFIRYWILDDGSDDFSNISDK